MCRPQNIVLPRLTHKAVNCGGFVGLCTSIIVKDSTLISWQSGFRCIGCQETLRTLVFGFGITIRAAALVVFVYLGVNLALNTARTPGRCRRRGSGIFVNQYNARVKSFS
jgi:hypothetical protein